MSPLVFNAVGGPFAVSAAATYEGALRRVILGFKETGRRDVLPLLAYLLEVSLLATAELADSPEVLIVPVPSSRAAARRRGEVPMHVLASATTAQMSVEHVRFAPILMHRRRVLDNAGLDRQGRQANLAGAFTARPGTRVEGRTCIVVDDIVTTGASLGEGVRALREAGAHPRAAAVVAVTPSRH